MKHLVVSLPRSPTTIGQTPKSMPTTRQPETRKFKGNTIKLELQRKVVETSDQSQFQALRLRICEALNVSDVMLGWWLNNKSQPHLGQVAIIAQILDVPADQLIKLAA